MAVELHRTQPQIPLEHCERPLMMLLPMLLPKLK